METYANLSGQSSVRRYQAGPDYIIVEFAAGREAFYKYTYLSAGAGAIEYMKVLASRGYGLNSYISINKPGYASKSSSLIMIGY